MTGAAGYIGRHLVAALARQPWVETVLAVDRRRMAFPDPPSRVVPLHLDLTATPPTALEAVFRSSGTQAVVPLAFLLRPGRDRGLARRINVGALETTLRACGGAGVHYVLYLSSATVYGAHPDNPIPLTEDAPLRPNRGFVYGEDKTAAEGVLRRWGEEHPEARVTVLRGCPVLGPGADNFVARALRKPLLPACIGHNPPLQFLHIDDQIAVLLRLLREPIPGVYNLAGRETVRWREVARLARRPVVPLPPALLEGIVEGTWRLRLQGDSPAVGLAFIRWPFVVSTARLEEATGWRPTYTARQALTAFLGQGVHGHGVS